MFTKTEKGYLVLTLAFLAAGSGIKAYRHAAVRLGPFQEVRQEVRQDTLQDNRQETRQVTLDTRDTSETPPTVLAAGSVSPEGDASRSDGEGVRDTVSDSSNGSSDPISHGSTSVSASESHRNAGPFMPLAAPRMPPKTASKTASRTKSKTAFNAKVDLNRAEAPELTRVPGIGAKTAQAIVEYRRAHGPYRDFRDLLQIKGIGEKKLEKLKPNLIL